MLGDAAAVLYGQMDDSDVQLAVGAMQESPTNNLPGAATGWENRATGNSGSIEAGAVFVTNQGVFCGDYEERLRVGGVVGTGLDQLPLGNRTPKPFRRGTVGTHRAFIWHRLSFRQPKLLLPQ